MPAAASNLYAPEGALAACAILTEAARAAGEIALGFFRSGKQTSATIQTKDNGTPVTQADLLCDRFLASELRPRFAEAGWLSEESADDLARLEKRATLIVDPIDGTRGFVAGDPRWTICVALVIDGRPLAAVVHAPALGETYTAALGSGAMMNGSAIHVSSRTVLSGSRAAGPKGLMVAICADGTTLATVPKIPSLAYRLVSVASGMLDVTFTSNHAHDWDVAAADLVIHEAGGAMTYMDGSTPHYNARTTAHAMLAAGSPAMLPALRTAVERGLIASKVNRPS